MEEEKKTGSVLDRVRLLGEEDFLPFMESDNAAWMDRCVQAGNLEGFDGTLFRYYFAVPEGADTCVVMVHGFCEFYGKYHELSRLFYDAGYAFFFMEQRGHGYSGGKMEEPDLVHIDSYDTYVRDLETFIDKVVMPKTPGMRHLLFAHSMGGAVSALYLEKHPETFDAAYLSSPMLKMKTGKYSPAMLSLVRIYMHICGKKKTLAPGQKRFDRKNVFETSSALSRPRYEYMFAMRLEDPHYRTYGATLGWVMAGIACGKKILRDAGKIKTPLTIYTAGQDTLVDVEGIRAVAAKVPGAVLHHYENSRHEIFNAGEEERKAYFRDLLREMAGEALE